MKKILALIILSFSGLTYADGNNDWQNIDENIIKLNSLNSCQGCLLRNTNFIGADLNNAFLSGADFISADLATANLDNLIIVNLSINFQFHDYLIRYIFNLIIS